jgi:hypothetical protein
MRRDLTADETVSGSLSGERWQPSGQALEHPTDQR